MKDYIQQLAMSLWQDHPGKCAGGLGGALLAIFILLFGFWNIVFVMLLGAVGLFIGMNVDREGNTWQNIKDCIPQDFHRFR